MCPMSDPKRVYTKLEQSSLRLALGDSSLRSAIHSPAAPSPRRIQLQQTQEQ
ncbi:hypothetical protein DSO57_1014810 [Entomophthora muscae]|uniref:Uncharacterized protein n=1 Tax=Entomophthora muscae TaxID=34485 RepID=A0ACC2RK12_9FUNG|nr:hypothetical protein DSO57_1014810 [Entomophthora muscae]